MTSSLLRTNGSLGSHPTSRFFVLGFEDRSISLTASGRTQLFKPRLSRSLLLKVKPNMCFLVPNPRLSLLALVVVPLCATSLCAKEAQALLNYEKRKAGKYEKSMLQVDSNKQLKYLDSTSRLEVAAEKDKQGIENKFLRVTYPVGGVGSKNSGAQFKVKLPPSSEYTLEYRFRFQPGFDFRKGGKLPGICGGACNTGKKRPDGTGWSLRYMWREEGQLFAYLYHMDQPNEYGEYIPLDTSIKQGQWHHILQRVKLNRPRQRDGELQVWVDGKQRMTRKGIAFRKDGQAPIDTFYFSTFFGGSKKTWAPKVKSFADFDDFRVRQL